MFNFYKKGIKIYYNLFCGGSMYNHEKILKIISSLNLNVLCNEPMCNHTSFKIGGKADFFVTIESVNTLKQLIEILNDLKINFFLIGNGSNLLVSDCGFRGVIIKLGSDFRKIKLIDDETIECGASALLAKLCTFAQQNSLCGLEFAYGIPGSVGGAVFMNAGAYESEIKNVIISAKSINYFGETINRNIDNMELSYRTSIYKKVDEVILSAKFKLKKGDKIHIKQKMNDFVKRRKEKQPLEYPSAGSIFKRPVGNFAGTLIQSCGLKGKQIGDAMVSPKHCGFIINTGKATCSDVVKLIDHIKAVVFEKTDIVLECEVETIGDVSY